MHIMQQIYNSFHIACKSSCKKVRPESGKPSCQWHKVNFWILEPMSYSKGYFFWSRIGLSTRAQVLWMLAVVCSKWLHTTLHRLDLQALRNSERTQNSLNHAQLQNSTMPSKVHGINFLQIYFETLRSFSSTC